MSRHFAIVTYGLTAIFFALFFVWPIATTLKEAFVPDGHFSLEYFKQIFTDRLYLEGLRNAFALAVFSTLGCFIIAMPLAFLSDRFQFPGKAVLGSLVLTPLILPPFVGAIGIKQILGQDGALNAFLAKFGMMDLDAPTDWLGEGRFWGIVIMNALHLYPIVYLNVSAALANLDPAMEESAANLGASAWRRFQKITLPLTLPGLFAGGTIVFIWSFTELGVPLIFDYHRVTSVQIFDGIKDLSGNPTPYALVAVMLVVAVVLFALSKLLLGRDAFSTSGRAAVGRRAKSLTTGKRWACSGVFSFIILLALIPHIGVILLSLSSDWYQTAIPEALTLSHYAEALGHELTVPSIANSLKYATFSTLLDLILGVAIAYVVVRTRLPGRQALDAVAMLPLAVPGLVLAFGYLAMTQEGAPFHFLVKNFMLSPGDPFFLLVIAYAVRRLPYVVRSAAAGFQQTSVTLEEAAQNLGVPPLRTLWKITVPLIAANLIAGGLLAFSFAMLEVSDSLILAQQPLDYPITKAIYTLFGALGNGHTLAAALGVWAMVFLGVTIVGAGLILGKKLGALFRV